MSYWSHIGAPSSSHATEIVTSLFLSSTSLPSEALIFNSPMKLPPSLWFQNSEDGNRIMQRNGALDSDCYGFIMHRYEKKRMFRVSDVSINSRNKQTVHVGRAFQQIFFPTVPDLDDGWPWVWREEQNNSN
uniref:Uncharacterized protein n=1 Tax=Populus trichocarpa TaxID=3694 RepID=U5G070_POPTR